MHPPFLGKRTSKDSRVRSSLKRHIHSMFLNDGRMSPGRPYAIQSGRTTPGVHSAFIELHKPQAGRELLNEELGRE